MEKVKLALMVAAVVLGIGGAVTTNAANHKATHGTSYYWFGPGGVGDVHLNDETNEMSTNCPGSASECEDDYNQSQLVNGDPSQGVIPAQ